MVRSTCVLLLLVCACDDEPAQSSPEVTHVAAPQPATEPTTEVEPTQEPPKPLSPPRPPRPSLDPNLALVAALRPIERDEVDGGTRLVVGHDGYLSSHGLTHVRTLHLSDDGRVGINWSTNCKPAIARARASCQ